MFQIGYSDDALMNVDGISVVVYDDEDPVRAVVSLSHPGEKTKLTVPDKDVHIRSNVLFKAKRATTFTLYFKDMEEFRHTVILAVRNKWTHMESQGYNWREAYV